MRTDVVTRPATPDHVEGINGIYNWYVANSAATFDLHPMPAERRQAWLLEHGGGRHRVLVAEQDGIVLGFASSGRLRARPAYDTSVETSVYVDHTRLGDGIGSRLYGALFEALAGEDLHRAYAGITVPNPGSIALHERFGFRLAGRFTEQGWKFGRYWDVAWFEKPMPAG